jgi:hypothetical protein
MSDSQALLVLDIEGLSEQENHVVSLIAAGVPYKDACAQSGMTTYRYQQLRVNKPAFEQAATRARTLSIDLEVDDMREIIERTEDQQKARNLVDAIKWRAARIKAAMYGDKLQLEHSLPPDLMAALSEAKSRSLRPTCDPAITVDAEYVDVSSTYNARAADTPSSDPVPVVPDIFS